MYIPNMILDLYTTNCRERDVRMTMFYQMLSEIHEQITDLYSQKKKILKPNCQSTGKLLCSIFIS